MNISPVEIWQRGGMWRFRSKTKLPLKSVTIAPDTKTPDINPNNNTWQPLKISIVEPN